MKILIFSFFFTPDFAAGSFRTQALLDVLEQKESVKKIFIFTTMPNRYFKSLNDGLMKVEEYSINHKRIKIFRFASLRHHNNLILQIFSFLIFALFSLINIFKIRNEINFIYATSSRFATAFLAYFLSRLINVKINLDIRDIFSENLSVIGNNNFIIKNISFLIKKIEMHIFKNADSISYVSKAFFNNFTSNRKKNTIYIPNGIDDLFLENKEILKKKNPASFEILYAGNIGLSQNLHNVIPNLSIHFNKNINFKIIGDGNGLDSLLKNIKELKCKNVEIIEPMRREMLINYYNETDIFFLHLGKEKAFEKVLPSKIFEYAVFDKPILAGVSGNAKQLIKEELKNSYLFEPENIDQAKIQLREILKNYQLKERSNFIKKYNRRKLMSDLASHLEKIHINNN